MVKSWIAKPHSMKRAAAPTSNASLLEIVSRNQVKRGPGAEVIVFSHRSTVAQGCRRARRDNTRLHVYSPFLTKTFTMALLPCFVSRRRNLWSLGARRA